MKKIATAFLGLSLLSGCVEGGSTGTMASGDSPNRAMNITNQTGVTMTYFQASSSSDEYWGPDRLGQAVLESGQFTTIHFNDGSSDCFYDFKAEFEDGDEVIDNKVNICEETGLTYY